MEAIGGRSSLPLVVIVGPTASGKTGLAVKLASRFGGEVISADSRAIYKDLDIGTAKPTAEERRRVPHWGIDLVVPGERFTAVDFQRYAKAKIQEIRGRGRVPFLAGGTGLYVDSVVYDYAFPSIDDELSYREELDALSLNELYEYCLKNNIILPENYKNKRYVVNAILRNGQKQQKRSTPIDNAIIVGITTEKTILRQRIEQRGDDIFRSDVVREARNAASRYGWDNEAMTGNIYPLIRQYLDGHLSLEEAQQRFVTLDWRLAKRQLTWLRRSEHITWLPLDEAYTYCARLLVKVNNS